MYDDENTIMKQKGFSLIEMMVGFILGLILSLGLVHYFTNQSLSYQIQDSLNRLQENGLFAAMVLRNDIRMAGYQGCPKTANVTAINLSINQPDNAVGLLQNTLVRGSRGSGGSFSPALPNWLTSGLTALGSSVKPNTDVLIVRKASSSGANLSSAMSSSTSAIAVTNRINFVPNQYLLISDCQTANIFTASTGTTATSITHTTATNISSALSKAYATDASVYPYQVFAYYVRATGRTNTIGAPIYALYRMDQSGNEEELSEGIEDLKFRYGIDTDTNNSVDSYQTADVVQNNNQWDKVYSVQINFLGNTVEPTSAKSQNYTFNGTTVTSSDLLLRREWQLFVMIRNR